MDARSQQPRFGLTLTVENNGKLVYERGDVNFELATPGNKWEVPSRSRGRSLALRSVLLSDPPTLCTVRSVIDRSVARSLRSCGHAVCEIVYTV